MMMHRHSPRDRALPGQPPVVLRRRQRAGASGEADNGLRPAQPGQAAVQQPDGAPGRGQGHQLATPTRGSSTSGSTPPPPACSCPGTPYYSQDLLSRPTTRPGPRSSSSRSSSRPASRSRSPWATTNSPSAIRAPDLPGPAVQAGGRSVVSTSRRRAERAHRQRPGRASSRPTVAPVRGGRTRTSTTSSGAPPPTTQRPVDQHGPQQRPPRSRRPCRSGGPAPTPRPGSRPTRRSTSTWPRTSPTCGTTGPRGRSWPTPQVQNFNNPTTPTGGKAYGMIGGSIWPTQIWKTS